MLTPLASHFLAGSILSLVLPASVLIAVITWYWIVWRRGTEEGVKRHEAARAGELPPTDVRRETPPAG